MNQLVVGKSTEDKVNDAKAIQLKEPGIALEALGKRVRLSESTLRRHGLASTRPAPQTGQDARGGSGGRSSSLATPQLARGHPGVYPGAGGLLRHNPSDFGSVLEDAFDRYRVDPDWVVRDYHIGRTLWKLYQNRPGGVPVHAPPQDGTAARIGMLVFAGGTALSMTHQLIDRISEDLDSVAACEVRVSKGQARKIRRPALVEIAKACSPETAFEAHKATSGGNVGGRLLTVGSTPEYLKADVSFWQPLPEETLARIHADTGGTFELVKVQPCQSLMGRAASAAMLDAYPELCPFEVPALSVSVTACNKLFALHSRSCDPDKKNPYAKLRTRGRDLYDLWAIASSAPHADEARAAVRHLAPHIADGLIKEPHPRPGAGFAASPALVRGTAANEALRAGYNDALPYVWGRLPATFDEAVEAAKSLDP